MDDKTWLDEVRDYLISKNAPVTQGHQEASSLSDIDRLVQGPVETSSETVKNYANGGIVDNDFLGQLNAGSIPSLQFDAKAGLPPAPTPMVQQPPVPVSAPNPVQSYLDTQKAKINRYGPEQQLAVQQDLMRQRQSLPQRGAVALGGLADAISGVGGRNSGYADRIQNTQNQQATEQMGALERAGKQNLERTETESKLDAMNPSSELSKIAQQTWGPLLSKNGFKPEQISLMPASSIAALTGQTVEALKAEAEAKTAEASLGIAKGKAVEDSRHNKEMEGIAGQTLTNSIQQTDLAKSKSKVDAAKDLLSKSGNAKVWGLPIPFTSDVSATDKDSALNVLRDQMSDVPTFSDESEAKKAGLPDGTRVVINGVPGTWVQ